jgi:hypothetical protein
MSLWIFCTVSRSIFATDWPRNDSILKLFVAVGKIINATIVTSEPDDLTKREDWSISKMIYFTLSIWFKRANDSINISAPLLENSYRPAMKKYKVLSKSKS